MSKKFLQLITHSVARIDLNNTPATHEGLWTLTPAVGGILLVARSKNKLLLICAVVLNNTDFIAKHLQWMDEPYELQLISRTKNDHVNEKKLLAGFMERLNKSLSALKVPEIKNPIICRLDTLAIGIPFTGKIIESIDKSLTEDIPNDKARKAINSLNHLAAYPLSGKYSDYPLDILFDGSLIPTPMPKLSVKGYVFWDILQTPVQNPELLLFNSPYFNDFVKDLVFNPYHGMPHRQYIEWYGVYLKAIKKTAVEFSGLCAKQFQQGNFVQAGKYAEQSLQYLSSVNEQHVEAELVIAYYNYASVLLKQNQSTRAIEFLEQAKVFCIKLSDTQMLAKVVRKLEESKQKNVARALNFFDMPEEVILKIIGFLMPPDIAHFAQVSRKALSFANSPYLWKMRLMTDFTRECLPISEMDYRKQYQLIYKKLPKKIFTANQSRQLQIALSIGAEVWVERLIKAGALLKYHIETIKDIFKSGKKHIVELMLKNGLNVNKTIDTDIYHLITIFHMAAFVAPEILDFLVGASDSITILPELHVAVLKNDIETLKMLLSKKIDVDTLDICQCTALWWALLCNNYHAVDLLIKKGAKVDNATRSARILCNRLNFDIMDYIIRKGYVRCLQLLLEKDLSANSYITINGETITLLVSAAKHGQSSVMMLLLKHGALVDLSSGLNDNDLSALHRKLGLFCEQLSLNALAVAAKKNQIESLNILLEIFNPDLNIVSPTSSWKDHKDHFVNRNTVLVEAISGLAVDAVKLLLLKGADPNMVKFLIGYEKGSLACKHEEGPLEVLLSLEILNKIGHELQQPNYDPRSDIAEQSRKWLEILEYLLKYGVDINSPKINSFIINLLNKKLGKNNLSAQKFFQEAFLILLKYKANFAWQDDSGKTALHYAVKNDYSDIVCFLVEQVKVDINIKDKKDETAIFLAAKKLDEDIFEYLKRKGAIVDKPNLKGETAVGLISALFMKRLGI